MEQFILIGVEKTYVIDNSLFLQNRGLNNIEEVIGLDKLHNLLILDLSFNSIEKISGLESLMNMENLTITNNKIKDMKGLSKLENLKSLNLSCNQINEINYINSLHNLEELILFENDISTIENLNALKKLKTLRLDFNKIEVILGIDCLKNLEDLSLSNNRILEITNIDNLRKLKSLNLSNNRISNIKELENNTELVELYLYTNQISKIEGLDNLRNLKTLYLFDNNINNIEGLTRLHKLETLLLSNNNISSINGLDNLTKLSRLELDQNQLFKIEGLDSLVDLEYLMLIGNELTIIEGLNSLKKLKVLSLDYNNIIIINGLKDLDSLETLSLSHNNIKRITGIKHLTLLDRLNFQNNEISKLGDILELSKTKSIIVNLLGNKITNSEEYRELANFLMMKIDIDFFKLKEIRYQDISNLHILLDRLLNTEKYGYSSWIRRPFKFSSDFDKEILDKIIHLFNTKLSLIRDLKELFRIYDDLLPFLEDRIKIEQSEDVKSLLKTVNKMFLVILENDTNKKIEGINKIYKNLKLLKMIDINSMFSYSISILNLVNSILEKDFVKYNENLFNLLNTLPEDYNIVHKFNVRNILLTDNFVNPIMHRFINIILEKIRDKKVLKNINQITNLIENITDTQLKNYLSQLRIEKIVIDESIDGLDNIRLYFAEMNLRYHFYDQEKGNFHLDYQDTIYQMIQENLNKSKEKHANLIIFPEYSFPESIITELIKYSRENDIWIIGGLERFEFKDLNLTIKENGTIIIPPNHHPILQKKHFKGKSEPELIPDNVIKIIKSKFGTFCVLICADFLESYLLSIIREQVDFIVVPSFNRDVKSFKYSAYDKCYSNMCYIMICNILKYNESSIFAPFRKKDRIVDIPEFPYIKLNLTDFSQHRIKKIISPNYKKLLSDSLYNLRFESSQ